MLRAARSGAYDTIFADPPDNLGLKYDGYADKIGDYYDSLIYPLIEEGARVAKVVWISYYWQHDIEIKGMVRDFLRHHKPSWRAKTFIWRYTFGQHNANDCGSGFRFLLRLSSSVWVPKTEGIRVQSVRQAIGDRRADPRGRVPDDVWDFDADGVWHEFPRVVGNSSERRSWHPTQHPEALLERILRLSDSRRVFDCFLGTGTTMRVAKRLGIHCDGAEISQIYCDRLSQELDVSVQD